jgi:hypothetical protein
VTTTAAPHVWRPLIGHAVLVRVRGERVRCRLEGGTRTYATVRFLHGATKLVKWDDIEEMI